MRTFPRCWLSFLLLSPQPAAQCLGPSCYAAICATASLLTSMSLRPLPYHRCPLICSARQQCRVASLLLETACLPLWMLHKGAVRMHSSCSPDVQQQGNDSRAQAQQSLQRAVHQERHHVHGKGCDGDQLYGKHHGGHHAAGLQVPGPDACSCTPYSYTSQLIPRQARLPEALSVYLSG